MPESTVLSVLSLESVTAEGEVVCVVRCIEGTATLGMEFANRTTSLLTLTRIEWYGKEVEQLDAVHHGRVTLTGPDAGAVRPRDTLTATDPNRNI
ncbi:hypothetical protein ABZ557_13225 [Streptomyces sp. NPDC019645]|uniref:hypothetical protein n=1 Tax=Streptomyces sp. NPDC019645 TaxID=3154786 RepID=UPI00340EB7EC